MILLDNSIAVFKNQIPIGDCQYFIKKFDQLETPQIGSRWSMHAASGVNYREGISKKIVDYDDRYKYNSLIKPALVRYLEEFELQVNIADCGYDIAKYAIGEKCNKHYDGVSTGLSIRVATVLAFLSSCKGGTLVFPRQNAEIPVSAGTIVIFPPYYTHPHYATPVEEGEKYIIVTWIEEI